MNSIQQEKHILESNGGMFCLTSHKVRFNSIRGGSGSVVSIMLEHVTSCEIAKRSNPIFLVLAALAFVVGGIVSAKAEETAPLIIGIIVAVVFVVFYFATRSQVLAVSSPSSRITIDTKDIPLEKVLQVIDEVEAAKDRRLVAISRT